MAHVQLPEGVPGILGLLATFPETARHLNGLTQALLRGPSSLTPAERETIAAYVSSGNDCSFCAQAHAAVARRLSSKDRPLVDLVLGYGEQAPVSGKLKALVVIAEKVRQGGCQVTEEDIGRAREAGADDKAIHDTVLIAAAFCMFNRYVDGLATWAPQGAEAYEEIGALLAAQGYEQDAR